MEKTQNSSNSTYKKLVPKKQIMEKSFKTYEKIKPIKTKAEKQKSHNRGRAMAESRTSGYLAEGRALVSND
jgi:hypothetical protein